MLVSTVRRGQGFTIFSHVVASSSVSVCTLLVLPHKVEDYVHDHVVG